MEGFVFVTPTGDEATLASFDVSERPEPVEFDFFCGVRRYVVLECGGQL